MYTSSFLFLFFLLYYRLGINRQILISQASTKLVYIAKGVGFVMECCLRRVDLLQVISVLVLKRICSHLLFLIGRDV